MSFRNKIYYLLLFLLLPVWAVAQTENFTGIIKDSKNGAPIPAATILVKGTQSGFITNENGFYTISAKEGDTLKITALGYRPVEIRLSNLKENNIALDPFSRSLDEVVVTALNISKKKKSLGYAVQEIKSDDINETKEPNLVNALQGKIAGVNITNSQGEMGSSRIVIRGETSISGNNQPLFVVDGVPVDNTQLGESARDISNAIADLNPDDIASISVLKGPNAAALYGSRAASGAILITTKDGRDAKGFGITINSNTTLSNVIELPRYQNIFGQGSNGEFKYVDGKGGGINDAVDESWGPKMDGREIPQFFSNGEPVPFVPDPDNVKDFFNTGYKLDNSVSLARSDDHYHFRLSYNNMTQHGTIPNTEQQKNSFSLNAGLAVTPRLSVGGFVNYIRRDAPNYPGIGGSRAASPMLQFAWFGRQVSTKELKRVFEEGEKIDGNIINWNNLYYSNMYFSAHENTVSQQRDRFIGDINVDYKIIEGLTANFKVGNDHYSDKRKARVAYGTSGTPFGSYEEHIYGVNETNTSFQLNFDRNLSSDFALNILAGGNIRTNTTENNDQKASRLAVPDVYTLENTSVTPISSNFQTKLKTYSLYSSAQIGFRDFAFINLSARNDWSSSLPKENLSYFYPSINGSLVLNELLHINNNNIEFLKLRGGWSRVGKATDAYQLINTYLFSTPFGDKPQLSANTIDYNPNLKPEQTSSEEVGVEVALFRDRIHLDASYYNMNSFNQILAVDVSSSTGYRQELINGGKINNRGVEIVLGLTPVRKGAFEWNLLANYAKNHSRVINLDADGRINSFVLGGSGTVQVLAAVDQPYGTLFGTAYLRDSKGAIIVGSDGLPATNPDKTYLGKYTPQWTGGLTNTFSYGRLSLDFLIDASFGGSIYSGTNAIGTYTGVLASTLPGRDAAHGGIAYYYPDDDNSRKAVPAGDGHSPAPNGETIHDDGVIVKGVTRDGEENDVIVPAQSYYKSLRNIDEVWVYDASYVKLREVRIGYRFEPSFLKSIGLQSATVSLVGHNLWIISKHIPNIDPETALSAQNGGQGLESYTIPSVRNFGVNINLKF